MMEKVWKKENPPYTVGGNVNWYSHYGEQYESSLKKQNRANIWSFNPTPGQLYPNILQHY